MAMEEVIVEVINRETIKPSKPTPLSLKNLKLSFLDQLAPMICVPGIYFYSNDSAADDDYFVIAEERSQRLKKSLSKLLTRFYPFAGRISSCSSIECNDRGVDYIEARVNCLLQDILKKPDLGSLKKLVPMQMDPIEAAKGDVFLVKVNIFQCGGMAIGVSISHKIADVSAFNLFVNSWAATSRGSRDLVLPDFSTAPSLFPPIDLPFPTDSKGNFRVQKVATRRLVFDAWKISMLKALAASLDVPQPTRVEAVSALIWKCAMAATASNRGGFKRPSGLLQAANLRKSINPPLSEKSMGNLAIGFVARSSETEGETELNDLVKKLRSKMRGLKENIVNKLQGSNAVSEIVQISKEIGNFMSERDADFYICSSWCGFDFYGADFGWGTPRWIGFGSVPPLNYFNLMDSRDHTEGIEVWLTLGEAEMSFFECNEELLAFASVDPSITLEPLSSPCESTAPCRKFNSKM